ncbi:MAG TPA: hypothetical protein VGD98_13690 [Ktedonobacteraceae bacterium]
MQTTDIVERLDELSQESRQQLNEQIERVQKEARKLRAQVRDLRREQKVEIKQRKKLLEEVASSGKEWTQDVLQRGNDLAVAGVAQVGTQLRSGQQKAVEYGGNLVQGAGQLGSQATHNLTDWSGDTSKRLLKQGKQLSQNASDWGDETTYRLRKQGRRLAQDTSEWGDNASYQLRKQKQTLLQNVTDWSDETGHRLRKGGRNLGHNLAERKDDAVRQVYRQKRDLGRTLADSREDATRQLRRQGRKLGRNLSEKREDAMRQMQKQRAALSERLRPAPRPTTFWSVLGFIAGLLLAGGVTYWLVQRLMNRSTPRQEASLNLNGHEPLKNVNHYPEDEPGSITQGRIAVINRPATSAGPLTRFVGVQSTLRYYPVGLNPDAPDLVFFEKEADARAQGFSAAQ